MSYLPPVSIVIPVRNGAATITKTLQACLAQEYGGTLEVIVADGMSEDGTRHSVAAVAERDPRVRVVDNPAQTAPAGLNRAIRAAQGDVIVRCDAHALLPPGYVARAVDQLAATGAANVAGVQRAIGRGTVQRAIAAAMTSPIGVGDARYRYGGTPGPTDTAYLGNYRRQAIDAAGLFDESMIRNQDYELNYRLRARGETVWFDPDLVVEYTPRSTFSDLARQYYDYGIGKRRMLRLHPRSLRWRQLAAPGLVTGLAGSGISALLGGGAAAIVLPAAYAAVLAVGTGYELVRSRDLAALLFPAAVATMHLAWGTGFLAESLGFAGRADAR